ncbi:tyrosine phosphatase family protein [Pararhizobium sp. IMCC21322]|uniref:tyrosine phosphatase family protein n=1 Tax=Pararhizobium sp. IMCC21322 TaxID=3067903 RepID=UPI0027424D57|nr:tyrosine phosphatase family protein [Pararhizobium sp. IMCC21322]
MSAIYVCSLDRLEKTASDSQASHMATLINADTIVARPPTIEPENHLFLGFNDINEPLEGMLLPGEQHVREFVRFVENWDQAAPLIVHCWAGVSRSTAGAMIATCLLRPDLDEKLVAATIRARSPEATPNKRLVALADYVLGREGRMLAAVEDIGRGIDCFEGSVFHLSISGVDDGTL